MTASSHVTNVPRMVAEQIPGYDYGSARIAKSPITMEQFELLKQSAGFSDEDERWLHMAGSVLEGQTKDVVLKWRSAIASQPHLAKYSLGLNAEKDPRYSELSGLRFEQWILDTCLRPYDQDWLNYQQEIALRHTSVKKNKTDHVQSAPTVHLRYIIAFTAVVTDSEIMKPFLSAKGHNATEVEKMHRAWCKSLLLQIALWTEPYTNADAAPNEW
jgi:hypothetical protein